MGQQQRGQVNFTAIVGKLDPEETQLVALYSRVQSDVAGKDPETKESVTVVSLGFCADLGLDVPAPSATFPLWSTNDATYYVRLALATNVVVETEGVVTNVTGLVRGDINLLTCEFRDEAGEWQREVPSFILPGTYKIYFRASAPNHATSVTNCTVVINGWDFKVNMDGMTGYGTPIIMGKPEWIVNNNLSGMTGVELSDNETRYGALDAICANGLRLWQRDKKPMPECAGFVARPAGFAPGVAERGAAAARDLAGRVLALYDAGDPDDIADLALRANLPGALPGAPTQRPGRPQQPRAVPSPAGRPRRGSSLRGARARRPSGFSGNQADAGTHPDGAGKEGGARPSPLIFRDGRFPYSALRDKML